MAPTSVQGHTCPRAARLADAVPVTMPQQGLQTYVSEGIWLRSQDGFGDLHHVNPSCGATISAEAHMPEASSPCSPSDNATPRSADINLAVQSTWHWH